MYGKAPHFTNRALQDSRLRRCISIVTEEEWQKKIKNIKNIKTSFQPPNEYRVYLCCI